MENNITFFYQIILYFVNNHLLMKSSLS